MKIIFFKEKKKKRGDSRSYQPPPRSALPFLLQNTGCLIEDSRRGSGSLSQEGLSGYSVPLTEDKMK